MDGATLGIRFNALGKMERAAVAAYMRGEYDKLIFQQPNSYVSKNAQTDPEQWQGALRELIAGDAKRVEAIVEAANRSAAQSGGFTLIELSIVLVVIGLIVGGILVGRDLIRAAEVRATISQIERYNTAANTFRGKYGYLPGDIRDPDASTFGFAARGQYQGEGDGNGTIEGVYGNAPSLDSPVCISTGETALFWVDLSAAGLIEGSFNTGTASTFPSSNISGSNINLYLPEAKLGRSNFISARGGGYAMQPSGTNYFTLSAISLISTIGRPTAAPNIPVSQAYAIDNKVDDGLPQSGNVTAQYANFDGGTTVRVYWAGTTNFTPNAYTTATPGSATTCFDNGNTPGADQTYTMTQNGGAGTNCALSFKFQ